MNIKVVGKGGRDHTRRRWDQEIKRSREFGPYKFDETEKTQISQFTADFTLSNYLAKQRVRTKTNKDNLNFKN